MLDRGVRNGHCCPNYKPRRKQHLVLALDLFLEFTYVYNWLRDFFLYKKMVVEFSLIHFFAYIYMII